MSKLSLQPFYPSTLVIDGVEIAVQVKRLSNRAYDKFASEFATYQSTVGTATRTKEEQEKFELEQDAWMRATLRDMVTIVAGELDVAGRAVTDASELLDLYGGRTDVAPQGIALIFAENHVSASKKRAFMSGLVSALGSLRELPETAPGGALEPTAASAEPSGSAPVEAATVESSGESSGMTDLTREVEEVASV